MNRTGIVLLFSLGFAVVGVLSLWSATRAASRTLPAPPFRNDDRHWQGGFIYNNPEDPDLFVPRRSWGWTVNFGHPKSAQLLLGIVCLVLASIALSALPLGPGCHTLGCTP